MRIIFILLASILWFHISHAQSLPERAKQRSKDKVGYKVDETVDKSVDSAFSKTGRTISNIFKKKDKKTKKSSEETVDENTQEVAKTPNTPSSDNKAAGPKIKNNSDFLPGELVVFEDHFEQYAEGDFPARWNTNGSGSIVTIEGQEGKWLNVVHNSIVNPVLQKTLPENCTIEFDLFLQDDGQHRTPFIQFGLTPVKNILKESMYYKDRFFMNIHRYTEKNGKNSRIRIKRTNRQQKRFSAYKLC